MEYNIPTAYNKVYSHSNIFEAVILHIFLQENPISQKEKYAPLCNPKGHTDKNAFIQIRQLIMVGLQKIFMIVMSFCFFPMRFYE